MKRVIDIHESDFKDIQEYDTIFEEENADIAKAIKTSESLNEVLDMIANEFEQNRLETIKLMNTPCQTKTMQEFKQQERYKADCDIICRTLQCAIDIINKYKESEE